MTRPPSHRLDDIDAAVAATGRHLRRGATDDPLVFDAVRARLIEIDEAVKDLPDALIALEPMIPWRQVTRMRDHLAHRYFDTGHAVVADTVENDLPELAAAVARLRRHV